MEKACKALPPYFYNFLKTNLKIKAEFLRRKIVNTTSGKYSQDEIQVDFDFRVLRN